MIIVPVRGRWVSLMVRARPPRLVVMEPAYLYFHVGHHSRADHVTDHNLAVAPLADRHNRAAGE